MATYSGSMLAGRRAAAVDTRGHAGVGTLDETAERNAAPERAAEESIQEGVHMKGSNLTAKAVAQPRPPPPGALRSMLGFSRACGGSVAVAGGAGCKGEDVKSEQGISGGKAAMAGVGKEETKGAERVIAGEAATPGAALRSLSRRQAREVLSQLFGGKPEVRARQRRRQAAGKGRGKAERSGVGQPKVEAEIELAGRDACPEAMQTGSSASSDQDSGASGGLDAMASPTPRAGQAVHSSSQSSEDGFAGALARSWTPSSDDDDTRSSDMRGAHAAGKAASGRECGGGSSGGAKRSTDAAEAAAEPAAGKRAKLSADGSGSAQRQALAAHKCGRAAAAAAPKKGKQDQPCCRAGPPLCVVREAPSYPGQVGWAFRDGVMWCLEEDSWLVRHALQCTCSVDHIAHMLFRTPNAVRARVKAIRLGQVPPFPPMPRLRAVFQRRWHKCGCFHERWAHLRRSTALQGPAVRLRPPPAASPDPAPTAPRPDPAATACAMLDTDAPAAGSCAASPLGASAAPAASASACSPCVDAPAEAGTGGGADEAMEQRFAALPPASGQEPPLLLGQDAAALVAPPALLSELYLEAPEAGQMSVTEMKGFLSKTGWSQPLQGLERHELVQMVADALPGFEVQRLLRCQQLPVPMRHLAALRLPCSAKGPPAPADLAEVRGAYRRLSRVVHPDKNGDCRATEAFTVLRAALESLSRARDL